MADYFPSFLARLEALPSRSEGRPAAGVGTPPGASTERSFWRRGTGIGAILSLRAGKGDSAQAQIGELERTRRHPRFWNFTVATQWDARRNLATETLRLRSAGAVPAGRVPAP